MRNADTVSCPIPRKDFMIDGRHLHLEVSHLCTALSALTVITSESVCWRWCVYGDVGTRRTEQWCVRGGV